MHARFGLHIFVRYFDDRIVVPKHVRQVVLRQIVLDRRLLTLLWFKHKDAFGELEFKQQNLDEEDVSDESQLDNQIEFAEHVLEHPPL